MRHSANVFHSQIDMFYDVNVLDCGHWYSVHSCSDELHHRLVSYTGSEERLVGGAQTRVTVAVHAATSQQLFFQRICF